MNDILFTTIGIFSMVGLVIPLYYICFKYFSSKEKSTKEKSTKEESTKEESRKEESTKEENRVENILLNINRRKIRVKDINDEDLFKFIETLTTNLDNLNDDQIFLFKNIRKKLL